MKRARLRADRVMPAYKLASHRGRRRTPERRLPSTIAELDRARARDDAEEIRGAPRRGRPLSLQGDELDTD